MINQTLDSLDGGENHGSIARLDINAPFGHVCFFRPAVIEQYLIQARTIEMINIMLCDHHSIPLCLKNSNIQLTLRVQYIKVPEQENMLIGTIPNTLNGLPKQQMVPYPVPLESYDLESEDPRKIGV
jgi:hypothetical protein